MDRRSAVLLTTALASTVVPLCRRANGQSSAVPPTESGSPYAMTPDYQVNWVLHKTSADAGATQIPTGVELHTSDPRLPTEGLSLWTRTPVDGDFTARFRYTRLDAHEVSPERGMATLFYWATLGEGTAIWPTDISAWGGYTAAEPVVPTTYAKHARGIRLSFNTFNSPRPRFSDQVRARYFFFTADEARPAIPPESQEVFRFPMGEARDIAIARQGDGLTFTSEAAANSVTRQSFKHPFIAQYRNGWIGFVLMPGRQCQIENFNLTLP
jgi:hypothetical protein